MSLSTKDTIETKNISNVLVKIDNDPEDKKSMPIFSEFEEELKKIDNINKLLDIDSVEKKKSLMDQEKKKLLKKIEEVEKDLSEKKKKEKKIGKDKMMVLKNYDKKLQEEENKNKQKIATRQETFKNNPIVKGINDLSKQLPQFQKNGDNMEDILQIIEKIFIKKNIKDIFNQYNNDISHLKSRLDIIKEIKADNENKIYKLNKKLNLLCQICNNNFASDMLHNFCNCSSGNQCVDCWWKLLKEKNKCVYCCKKMSFVSGNKISDDIDSLLGNSSIFIKDQKIAQEFVDFQKIPVLFFGKVTLVDKDKILVTFNDDDIHEYTHKEAQNRLIVLS